MLKFAAGLLAAAALSPLAHAQLACESLKDLQFPDVKISDAKPGPSARNMSPASAQPVPVCTVTGVIGREINFVVVLPDTWNGKFAMGGQGGIAGSVGSQAGQSYGGLQQGYAIAGTDTGHVAERGQPPMWAMDPWLGPERQVNYMHAAIHRVSVTAKAIVKARYGRDPDKSYFAGCSNGGRQALIEAIHYPDDFDAILAGAPSTNISTLTLARVDVGRKIFPDPKDFSKRTMDNADRLALGKAVLAKCDKDDGLEDGILSQPDTCKFDPSSIACKAGQKDECLTPGGLAAMKSLYGGAKENGVTYSPGFPMGGEGEGGWASNFTGSAQGGEEGGASYAPNSSMLRSLDFLRYFLGRPDWSYAGPTLASMAKDLEKLVTYNADNPDLSAFRKKGGKVLMFHGMIDPTISVRGTMDYTDKVYAHDAGAKNDVRFFTIPGMGHCGGGPGPQRVDWLGILDKWATGGPAPDEIDASFAPPANGQGGGARKLCAWPKKQVFKGQGDGRSPNQFECK